VVKVRSMSSLLVSIFGPDGSGKSTQARILAKRMASQKFKMRLTWIKSYHTLAYVLSRIYRKLSPSAVTLNAYGHIIRINAICSSRLGRLIWAWIEFVSLLPCVLLRAYLPLLTGKIVIADRYLVDSIVSIAYTLNEPRFDSCFLARIMLSLIPANSVLIYLYANREELKRRRGAMADPDDFLQFQLEMYDRLSRHLMAVKYDTTKQGIDEIAMKIESLVLQRLKG